LIDAMPCYELMADVRYGCCHAAAAMLLSYTILIEQQRRALFFDTPHTLRYFFATPCLRRVCCLVAAICRHAAYFAALIRCF